MTAAARFPAAVLTVSDSAASGDRDDESGLAAVDFVLALGGDVLVHEVVSDDRDAIAGRLIHFCDDLRVALVLTTGGTGFAPRDVTPEASRDVIEREAPGLAEAMRRDTAVHTPLANLSRGVSGIRGSTLIVNLPGSPRAVRQCLAVIEPFLKHGLAVLAGTITRHDAPEKTDP